MTRSLLPLTLLLLCTACVSSARPMRTPQATERGVAGLSAVSGAEVVPLATQTMVLERYETPTPNSMGTMAVMALQATSDEKVRQDRFFAATAGAYNDMKTWTAATSTAAIPLATERERAMSTSNAFVAANMTQSAAHVTETYVAPRDAATAEYLIQRKKSAWLDAWAVPFGTLMGGFGILVLSLAFAHVVLTRPQVQQVVAVAKEESSYFSRPWVPTSPTGFVTKPLPAPDADMYRFLGYAVSGLPLGENSMVKAGAWKSGFADRRKRQAIMAYLDVDCGHIKDHRMTPQGIDYWRDWMAEHTPHPALDEDMDENDDDSLRDHVNNDHVDGGEVVIDGEVLPETEHHRPQVETYYTALEPKKEGEG